MRHRKPEGIWDGLADRCRTPVGGSLVAQLREDIRAVTLESRHPLAGYGFARVQVPATRV